METGKIATITGPTLDVVAAVLACELGSLVVILKHDVVRRHTNAGSDPYDVSVHGVVFDRGILGLWHVGTSRVADTDPEVIRHFRRRCC